MKTNQVMDSIDRELLGINIRQRTKDSFFSLKDVSLVLDRWCYENGKTRFSPADYFKTKQAKELLASVKEHKNCEPYIRARGRGADSWIHPYIMIDILLWVDPHFKIQVYDWLMDFLIQNRIDSGDSYVKMCGSLYTYTTQKIKFQKSVKMLDKNIRSYFGVSDWNKATQEQLKLRDELQTNIADFAKTLHNSYQGLVFACDVYASKYNIDKDYFRSKIIPFYEAQERTQRNYPHQNTHILI